MDATTLIDSSLLDQLKSVEVPDYTQIDTGLYWNTCNIEHSLPYSSQFWIVKNYSVSGGVLTADPAGFLMSIQNRFSGNFLAPQGYTYTNRNSWKVQNIPVINQVSYITELSNTFTASGPPGVWWGYYNQKLTFPCRAIPIGYNPTDYVVIYPNDCDPNVVLTYVNRSITQVSKPTSNTQEDQDNLWQWNLRSFPGNSNYFQIVTTYIEKDPNILKPNRLDGRVLGSYEFPTSSSKAQLELVPPGATNTWWEYNNDSGYNNLLLHPGLPSPTQTNLAILELDESQTNNTCQLPGVDPNTNDQISATQFRLNLFDPLTANNKEYRMTILGGEQGTLCSAPPQIVFVPDYTSLPNITDPDTLANLLNSSWSLSVPTTQQDLPQNFYSDPNTDANGQFTYKLITFPPAINNNIAVMKIFQIDRNVINPSYDVSPIILDSDILKYEEYPALIQKAP
jgi:hypothetical protein